MATAKSPSWHAAPLHGGALAGQELTEAGMVPGSLATGDALGGPSHIPKFQIDTVLCEIRDVRSCLLLLNAPEPHVVASALSGIYKHINATVPTVATATSPAILPPIPSSKGIVSASNSSSVRLSGASALVLPSAGPIDKVSARIWLLNANVLASLIALAHPNSPVAVRKGAVECIAALIDPEETGQHESLLRPDLVPTLLDLMEDSNATIQEEAAFGLCNLSVNSNTKLTVRRANGIPRIIRALTMAGDPDIKKHTAEALSHLADDVVNRIEIMKHDGLRSLNDLLTAEHPEILEQAVTALEKLGRDPACRHAVRTADTTPSGGHGAGMLKRLVDLLAHIMSSENVLARLILECLTRYGRDSSICAAYKDTGVFTQIIAALESTSPDLVSAAALFCAQAATVPKNQVYLREIGVLPVLIGQIANPNNLPLPAHPVLVRDCAYALTAICLRNEVAILDVLQNHLLLPACFKMIRNSAPHLTSLRSTLLSFVAALAIFDKARPILIRELPLYLEILRQAVSSSHTTGAASGTPSVAPHFTGGAADTKSVDASSSLPNSSWKTDAPEFLSILHPTMIVIMGLAEDARIQQALVLAGVLGLLSQIARSVTDVTVIQESLAALVRVTQDADSLRQPECRHHILPTLLQILQYRPGKAPCPAVIGRNACFLISSLAQSHELAGAICALDGGSLLWRLHEIANAASTVAAASASSYKTAMSRQSPDVVAVQPFAMDALKQVLKHQGSIKFWLLNTLDQTDIMVYPFHVVNGTISKQTLSRIAKLIDPHMASVRDDTKIQSNSSADDLSSSVPPESGDPLGSIYYSLKSVIIDPATDEVFASALLAAKQRCPITTNVHLSLKERLAPTLDAVCALLGQVDRSTVTSKAPRDSVPGAAGASASPLKLEVAPFVLMELVLKTPGPSIPVGQMGWGPSDARAAVFKCLWEASGGRTGILREVTGLTVAVIDDIYAVQLDDQNFGRVVELDVASQPLQSLTSHSAGPPAKGHPEAHATGSSRVVNTSESNAGQGKPGVSFQIAT
ncbi:hypothetical protein CXG81DRAFT_21297 [Caulochytrium protostelioides]|uniref:ARM repeat-containing protein n=1 Tax=Caulochytrium protostelioides TaxID=1555241 RepID=A0A4P9WYI4_9FUNG|nr:ARM repeat-containing protein [Caulochytrium protostelioides]RKO98477.1 hypothetical protein CXG81DRAFT_21297 [Caulochytrium protostelioides]|eukprot:RKO98477.1 hypothetical protein CXG81DRAFT_21297 [Caulochytrium protostelioides]